MKLTRSVAYGVGILLQIKDAKGSGPVTAATIARDCKFPPRFLYRVLRRLVDAGLLVGTSGPLGGYELARRSEGITLLDIVNAVESPPEPTVLEPVRAKHRRAIQVVNRLCRLESDRFRRELKKVTLAKLRA
ncbi:MAG TPA: Rrf2 family transcriptional regulator [Pirellulales bacterium]|jgi:Rrf2 family protein|nr:Rrf2 family transcriptional regulator [Pirellulales bacterium]